MGTTVRSITPNMFYFDDYIQKEIKIPTTNTSTDMIPPNETDWL